MNTFAACRQNVHSEHSSKECRYKFKSTLFILICFLAGKEVFFDLNLPAMLFELMCVDASVYMFSYFLGAPSTAAARVPKVHPASWSGCVLRWKRVTRRRCFSCSCLQFTSSSVTTTRSETQLPICLMRCAAYFSSVPCSHA